MKKLYLHIIRVTEATMKKRYERIRYLREENDLTQETLAKQLNISQRAYSRYETGERAIPLDALCTLANYYHTSTDYLLNRTDIKDAYS